MRLDNEWSISGTPAGITRLSVSDFNATLHNMTERECYTGTTDVQYIAKSYVNIAKLRGTNSVKFFSFLKNLMTLMCSPTLPDSAQFNLT